MQQGPVSHDRLVITIPVYNEERFIAATIASVRAQTLGDFAVLISDNGSTDATEARARAAIGGDPRFHYFRQPRNGGAVFNFNWLLEATRSPIFMWLGSHDGIAPDYVARVLPALEAAPGASIAYALTQWVSHDGEHLGIGQASRLAEIGGAPWRRYLIGMHRVAEATAVNNLLRREAIGAMRLENVSAGDLLFLARLLHWGPALCVAEPLYLRRRHGTARTGDQMKRITGKDAVVADRSAVIRGFLEHWDRSYGGRPWSPAGRWLAEYVVRRKLDPDYLSDLTVRSRFGGMRGRRARA